jgi:hypothetical protein
MRSRLAMAALGLALVAALVACSDDDDSNTADTTDAAADTTDAADVEVSDDDLDFEVGISTRVTGLEVALGATGEVIDETTVELTFDSGEVDIDSIGACAVATSILEDGETAIVVYPDGEKTCE